MAVRNENLSGLAEIAETLKEFKIFSNSGKAVVKIRSRSENLERAQRGKDGCSVQYPVADVEIDVDNKVLIVKQVKQGNDEDCPYYEIYPINDLAQLEFIANP